jgi:small subunit ribosomal protein S16
MVKIRLTRTGRKHQPHYRIVAIDSRKKRDGDYLEKIGYYNPRTNPPTFDLDKAILKKWLDRGAQPTDTVFDLLVREGILKESKLRKKRVDMMIDRSKTASEKSKEKEESSSEKETADSAQKAPETKETPSTSETSTSQEKDKKELKKEEEVKEKSDPKTKDSNKKAKTKAKEENPDNKDKEKSKS